MKVSVRIYPWNGQFVYDSGNWNLNVGDNVIISRDSEIESAIVEKVNVDVGEEVPKIIRKTTLMDMEVVERNKQKSKEALNVCKSFVKKERISMKIVDAHFSFDGGKVTFSFIAEKRVDFRDLLKALSKNFQRSIRLQQIGSRDEARKKGGHGTCGRELCCVKFSGSLQSVTTEDARVQQMGQRGSERLSGLCGRLKCCLGFESEQYREMLKSMPEIEQIVEMEGKKGKIIERNILLKEAVVEFGDKSKKRVSVNELKW